MRFYLIECIIFFSAKIGDIVSLSENSVPVNELNAQKSILSGTVTKVTAQSVSVAIDNEIENIDEQLFNMPSGMVVIRGGTLKLVKMQARNAFSPRLSMPSFR